MLCRGYVQELLVIAYTYNKVRIGPSCSVRDMSIYRLPRAQLLLNALQGRASGMFGIELDVHCRICFFHGHVMHSQLLKQLINILRGLRWL